MNKYASGRTSRWRDAISKEENKYKSQLITKNMHIISSQDISICCLAKFEYYVPSFKICEWYWKNLFE